MKSVISNFATQIVAEVVLTFVVKKKRQFSLPLRFAPGLFVSLLLAQPLSADAQTANLVAISTNMAISETSHSSEALSPSSVTGMHTVPTVLVLDVACPSKDPLWSEGLVGLGVRNWIEQAFFDSGSYHLYEIKPEVLSAVGKQVQDVSQVFTLPEKANACKETLKAVAAKCLSPVLAIGRVTAFSAKGMAGGNSMHMAAPRPGSGFSGPGFQVQKAEVKIKVELALLDAQRDELKVATGIGTIKRSGTAILVDYGNKLLPFDASCVGPATQEAIRDAVAKLLGASDNTEDKSEGNGAEATVKKTSNDVAESPRPPLSVAVLPLSLRPEVAKQYPALKSRRVALGLSNRIASQVTNATGEIVELREIRPEVIEALQTQRWIASNGVPPVSEVSNTVQAMENKPGWVIYGEVFSFGVTQGERIKGLKGQMNTQVSVGVQLRAVRVGDTQPCFVVASALGAAAGNWQKWTGSDADFEQPLVGHAVDVALAKAWPKLHSILVQD